MGRMERYKRDAYHVGKHSRPTPRLDHVIFYLLIYLRRYNEETKFSVAPSFVLTHSSDSNLLCS